MIEENTRFISKRIMQFAICICNITDFFWRATMFS